MAACAIISGVILVVGVTRIRMFFKEREAEDFLDTKMLWRHALSFGLYLMSTVLWATTTAIQNIHSTSFTDKLWDVAATGDLIIQLIAQIMLCEIFWQWGKRTVEQAIDEETENHNFPAIETDDFDDSDLNALIWNTIINKRREEFESNFLMVTGSQIRRSTARKSDARFSATVIQEAERLTETTIQKGPE